MFIPVSKIRGLDTRFNKIGKVVLDFVPEDHSALIQAIGRGCRTKIGQSFATLVISDTERINKKPEKYE